MLDILKRLAIHDGSLPATGPGAPSGREMQRYLVAACLAAVPCLLVTMRYFGARTLAAVLAAMLGAAAVEMAFGLIRKKPIGGGALIYGVLFVLVVPPTIPLWMIALGSAVGVFFGKEIFGGTGHHIFMPVLVGKGFVLYSFPTVVNNVPYFGSLVNLNDPSAWVTASAVTLLGAAAMLVARPSNWRILTAIAVSGLCVAFALTGLGKLPEYYAMLHLVTVDGFLVGACFLACDPSCSPRSDSGKWLYGLMVGSVAVLMSVLSTYSEGMLSAILFGNLVAPTLNAIDDVRIGGRASS
jgi:Na+-transporting NADH:ubiquinone oxidoreductase subunit B